MVVPAISLLPIRETECKCLQFWILFFFAIRTLVYRSFFAPFFAKSPWLPLADRSAILQCAGALSLTPALVFPQLILYIICEVGAEWV